MLLSVKRNPISEKLVTMGNYSCLRINKYIMHAPQKSFLNLQLNSRYKKIISLSIRRPAILLSNYNIFKSPPLQSCPGPGSNLPRRGNHCGIPPSRCQQSVQPSPVYETLSPDGSLPPLETEQ